MSALSDFTAILRGDGLALDREEEEELGGPKGETISLWAAAASRHGSMVAHLFCFALWLVQVRHCTKTAANEPMTTQNYLRAGLLLVLVAPIVFLIGEIRKLTHG